MYEYEIGDSLQRILVKVSKKDKIIYKQILNKIEEIVNCNDITVYKNLKYQLSNFRRVHIGCFVLIFKVENSKITFSDFQHHDTIYSR